MTGRPDASRVWLRVAAKVVAAGVLALAVVVLVPGGGGGSQPPVDTLLVTGLLVAVATIPALYWTTTRDLKLPAKVALFACLYNLLIVVVKFVLAPHGLYEVNQSVDLTAYPNLTDPLGAVLAAGFVLVLYALGYWALYRILRRGLEASREGLGERLWRRRRGLGVLLTGAVLIAASAGTVVVIVPALLASTGIEYVRFVFASSVSLLVAVSLAVASSLVAAAFGSVAERARIVGDAAVLTGFFFVGLSFLAVYHALWVVYVLILTSIWPLKVVVPK